MKFTYIIAGFVLMIAYVIWRVVRMVPGGVWVRVGIGTVMLAATACFFLSFALRHKIGSDWVMILSRIGSSWILILLYMFLFLLLLHLIEAVMRWTDYELSLPPIMRLGIIVIIVANIFTYGYFTYKDKKRVELNIATGKSSTLPQQTLTIVALSDLHLGYNIPREEFETWIPLINREKPDIIVFMGDIIDNDVQPLIKENMAEAFHKLESKYGMYAVPGNHEYIAGIRESLRFMEQAGITVLRDSVADIDGKLRIVGRDDRHNHRRAPLQSLVQPQDSIPTLLLDHQPYNLEEAQNAGITLQLSGHTHHGQVFPGSIITNMMYELDYGSLQKGGTHYYVSSGIGLWGGKFRIGTRSEYVVVKLSS